MKKKPKTTEEEKDIKMEGLLELWGKADDERKKSA